jgi:hypothetical protein
MFDDAATVLEEIAPEDKTRNEVLGARNYLYMSAKKWDMAAAVASQTSQRHPNQSGRDSIRAWLPDIRAKFR